MDKYLLNKYLKLHRIVFGSFGTKILRKIAPYFNIVSLEFKTEGSLNKEGLEVYINENNDFFEKYKNLILGLDLKSKIVVETILDRLELDLGLVYRNYLTQKEARGLTQKNSYIFKKLFPGLNHYIEGHYRFHYGLRFFDESLNSYFNEKDCIDGGAFELNTAIFFSKHYPFKKIYSFEIDKINYYKGLEILSNFFPEIKNIVSKNIGLWKVRETLNIRSDATMSSRISVLEDSLDTKVAVTDIDSFVKENNLDVKLIKLDIEGSEYDAMLGAKETITQHLPVLLISMYHTFKDFFEIKPLIESYVPGKYDFYVRKLNPNLVPLDTILICIPKKLDLKINEIDNIEIYG